MAKIAAPTARDHPLSKLKPGGKPPTPPKPKAKAKSKPKAKKKGKK